MSNSAGLSALKLELKYPNNFRLVEALIYFYSKSQTNEILTKKECSILREYILKGYSDETKDYIESTFNIKRTNLNCHNYSLQKKGFLIPHSKNQNNKILSPELLKIKEFYEGSSEKKVILVNLIDENR